MTLNADVRIKRRAGPIQTFPEPSFVFNFNFLVFEGLRFGKRCKFRPNLTLAYVYLLLLLFFQDFIYLFIYIFQFCKKNHPCILRPNNV